MKLQRHELLSDSFVTELRSELQTLLRADLNLPGRSILCAVSGGPDSTALLIALWALQPLMNFDLAACHVNHQLRGEESKRDEEFCLNLASMLGIDLKVFVPDQDKKNKNRTDENTLRQFRYESLASCARESSSQFRFIAFGHTLDDQVETVLFRLFRGTGPAGLCGIPQSRALDEDIVLIRPMLSLERRAGLDFLYRNGIGYCLDSTNSESSYNRNFIRNQIVPLIEERFPGFVQRVENLRKLTEAEQDFVQTTSNILQPKVWMEANCDLWSVDELLKLHPALQNKLLWNALNERSIEASFERVGKLVEIISGLEDKSLSLNELWEIRRRGNLLSWHKKVNLPEPETIPDWHCQLNFPGSTVVGRLNIVCRIVPWSEKPAEPEEAHRSRQFGNAGTPSLSYPAAGELRVIVDLSSVAFPLTIRPRSPGDLIVPFGMQEAVKLKKYLHTHKSPEKLSYKGSSIVLADQTEVLWVPGVGLSDRLKVRTRPTHEIELLAIAKDGGQLC